MKKNKILLVMFAPYRTVQMQIAALSACLKKIGCVVRYVEIITFPGDTFETHKDVIERELAAFAPDFVGFSSYDMNYEYILDCASFVKKVAPSTETIVGGHRASLSPDDYITRPAIDYVVIGEAEPVLKDFFEIKDKDGEMESIPGLCLKGRLGKIVLNPARPLIGNLDELPFIDRSIVDAQQKELDYLPIFAGKGCPFLCTYCSNDAIKKLYPNQNRYVRYRTPENIIAEIEVCLKDYNFRYVYFYDDIFSLNHEWLKKFAQLYKKHFTKLPYCCLLNPSISTDDERIKLLADSGCETVFMGVESGSEGYRRRILKRNMTNKTILKAATLIRKYKMKLNIFMMVGLPGESILDLLKSISLNYRIRPDGAQTAIYYPLKNTPLYNYCIEHNLINEERRKKLLIYSYDTCLDYGPLRRGLIIAFKWLNSASPVFCHFRIDLIYHFLRIQFNKYVRKRINYR